MKGTQNLTLASKCFCGAVTHDLLAVENNIDFELRSWDQQCFQRTKASYLSHGTSTVAVRLDLVLLRNSFKKLVSVYIYV